MLRIGIDLGGTKTEGIVMDTDGEIIERERRSTPSDKSYDVILKSVRDLVAHLEQRTGDACSVGIGTPGTISGKTEFLKNSNTTCLNGKPLLQDLQGLLGRTIRMANDANCFALSEALDGAGKGYDVVFGVIMGTGVGGGIVVEGQLLEGLQHIAGEWGHNMLEPEGPICYCGKRGCVETLISGPGLARDYHAYGGDAELDASAIAARAASGDPLAESVMQRFLDRFGKALSMVINILDPHVVVLGGGLSNIDRLYHEGTKHLAKYVFNDECRTRILPNANGDSAGVRGAAQLWPAGREKVK